MHYYIDGYNLLFRVLPARENLQLVREAFIYDFSFKVSALNLDVTLVFDSHYQEGDSTKSHVDNLEIIYTAEGESADDYILKSLKRNANPKQHTVITSDNKLAWQARRLLTKTESVEDFIAMIDKRLANRSQKLQAEQSSETPSPGPASQTPKMASASEGSFDYYQQAFEEKLQDYEEELPEIVISNAPLLFEEEPPCKAEVEPYVSDEERWLKIFEERNKKLEENDDDFAF